MKMLKDSFWANGSALVTQIIALGTTLVVARFVGPTEYGLVATGLVILLFFQRFLLESFGFSVIRETDTSDGYIETANYCSIIFGFISSIVMIISAVLLYVVSYKNLAVVIIALSIIPILDGYGTIRTCLLRRDGEFKQLAGRVLIANTCAGLFAIVLAINNFGIWALIVQQIILAICNLLIAFKCANWKPLEKISKSNIKKIMKFGFPMMGNSVIFVAANRVDVLFLSFLSTPMNVGVYAMSRRITRTIPDILLSGSNNVLFTYLRKEDRHTGLKLTFKTIIYIFLLMSPVLTLLYVYSFNIVNFIFGKAWVEINFSLIIQLLIVGSIAQVFIALINTYFLSINEPKKVFLLNTFQLSLFVSLMFFYLFLDVFSAVAVAKCFVFSNYITMLIVILILTINRLENFILLFKNIIKFTPIWISLFVLFYFFEMIDFSLNSIVALMVFYLIILSYLFIFDIKFRLIFLQFYTKIFRRI